MGDLFSYRFWVSLWLGNWVYLCVSMIASVFDGISSFLTPSYTSCSLCHIGQYNNTDLTQNKSYLHVDWHVAREYEFPKTWLFLLNNSVCVELLYQYEGLYY
jgi:hypothetical protein